MVAVAAKEVFGASPVIVAIPTGRHRDRRSHAVALAALGFLVAAVQIAFNSMLEPPNDVIAP